MSQSPAGEAEFELARDPESDFRKSLKHINRLMRQGGSLSGHERNCTFINARGETFGTASSVAGFDFPDDARAVATTDWDADGDLDVWISNRTSPRVRFLRNDLPTPNQSNSLSLLLKGQSCNRDAVGARVSVYFANDRRPVTRTVRAGEGFLSQSSKWLHFGSGAATSEGGPPQVDKVEIRWPNGSLQTIDRLAGGKRYRIVENGQPEEFPSRSGSQLTIVASEPPPFEEPTQARVALTSPLAVPSLPYKPFSTEATVNAIDDATPTLINLWASWCQPCVKELRGFTKHQEAIRAVGLQLVAIAVDSELDERATTAVQLVEEMSFPFSTGESTPELIQRLKTIHGLPFALDIAMPVPVSFLVDKSDRVVAMYRGPVDVERLLQDVTARRRGSEAWQRATLPLRGRWNEIPAPLNRLAIPRDLLFRRQVNEAFRYVQRFAGDFAEEKEFPKLRAWLGDELIKADRARAGILQYQMALKDAPDDVTLMNNYAWQLATQQEASVRNGERAVYWAERAARATHHLNAGILDTLAASYAANGEFEKAVQTISTAIRLANDPATARRLSGRRDQYRRGEPLRD